MRHIQTNLHLKKEKLRDFRVNKPMVIYIEDETKRYFRHNGEYLQIGASFDSNKCGTRWPVDFWVESPSVRAEWLYREPPSKDPTSLRIFMNRYEKALSRILDGLEGYTEVFTPHV